MKLALPRKLAILATALLTSFHSASFVSASTFEQQEVTQDSFVAIARPYGENKYDLLIIEQIPGKRQCWSESGSNPVLVEPLLLNFDFTGSCERSTDSNGYSIRIDGQDYGLDYLLRLVPRNGELVLLGTNRINPSQGEIVVGRTYGMAEGFIKIILNPGWRFTKRTYQGRVLGHVYLTGDSQAMVSPVLNTATNVTETPPSIDSNSNSDNNSVAIKEYTFTADSASYDPEPNNNSLPAPVVGISPSNDNTEFNGNSAQEFNNLPPNPISPSGLKPISPPSESNAQIVPPPPPNASTNGRKNLSEILNGFNGNSTPTNPPPPNPVAQLPQGNNYRVLVEARNSSQQTQLRSLYPDAFPRAHNGQSFWQVGVFSSRDKAQSVLQDLGNVGLKGLIVQF